MSIEFNESAALMSHRLKQQRNVANVGITFNAVPASKAHSSDIPGALVLRTEGKTAEADAIEDISGLVTAASDATGVFAVLLDVEATKLYKVMATPSAGTIAITASGLTPEGRVYVDLNSSLDLSAASVIVTLEIEYKE